MLATIRDDTWPVLNMHIIPNSKRLDYSDIHGGSIKGPIHMAEDGHHLKKMNT